MSGDEGREEDDVSVTKGAAAPSAAEKPAKKKSAHPTKKKRKKPANAEPTAATKRSARKPSTPARTTASAAMPRGVRYGLLGGALAACAGIALVATSPSVVGTWVLVVAVVTLVASIHRLGRLGPEGLA